MVRAPGATSNLALLLPTVQTTFAFALALHELSLFQNIQKLPEALRAGGSFLH